MSIVNEFIQSIASKMEESHKYKNLTIHFIKDNSKENGIINYSEALIAKVLDITESGEGNISELKFVNHSVFPVFCPEGMLIEQLKQSRCLSVSCILSGTGTIDSKSTLFLPVTCVEKNRWETKSKYGNRSAFHIYSRLRASNLKDINKSLKEQEGYNSSDFQSNRWNDIRKVKERKERQLGRQINSPTDFVGDIYQEEKESIDAYINAFHCPSTAIGFLAMIDNHPVALEAFGNHRLCKGNFQGLLRALASEAMDQELCDEIKKRRVLTVDEFLRSITNSKQEQHKSIGLGDEVRFEGDDGVVGCCLVNGRSLVHIEAFA